MKYSIATLDDIDSILELHQKYHIDSIKKEDLVDGFVTTNFTKDELTSLIEDEKGIFIAKENNIVKAYVMSASWEFWSRWDMFSYMIKELDKVIYKGVKLSVNNSYQYGPICIDKSLRGGDVLFNIFEFAREHMAKRYPILVTFINKVNKRSFNAHKKLGLEVVNEFMYNNNSYYELCFNTFKRVKL